MDIEEVQTNSLHLAEEIPALGQSNHTSTLSPLQEGRNYIPNIFRGINTSGSYHVYGDVQVPTGQLGGSPKAGDLHRGGDFSMKRSSQVPCTNQATTVSSHLSYPKLITRPVGAHRSLQRPGTPMEEDNIQHPQTSCLRLSPCLIKGVICSPQSPLRSDCQPNSPTESNSSKNATFSLKPPSDCPIDAKAHNWKKYKLIVMNQSPDGNETVAQGGSTETTAMSRTPSPCRTDTTSEQHEIRAQEGDSEHRKEILMSQSDKSCGIR